MCSGASINALYFFWMGFRCWLFFLITQGFSSSECGSHYYSNRGLKLNIGQIESKVEPCPSLTVYSWWKVITVLGHSTTLAHLLFINKSFSTLTPPSSPASSFFPPDKSGSCWMEVVISGKDCRGLSSMYIVTFQWCGIVV